MAVKERDVVLTGKDSTGNPTIDLPITRLGNIEAGSEDKTTLADADAIPVLDSTNSMEMKKISWANFIVTIKKKLEAVFAAPSVTVTFTLTAAGWSGSAPHTQTVSVAGLGASSNGSIGLPPSATAAQREAARKAIIGVSAQAAGSITVVADGIKPAVDIPAQVIILG